MTEKIVERLPWNYNPRFKINPQLAIFEDENGAKRIGPISEHEFKRDPRLHIFLDEEGCAYIAPKPKAAGHTLLKHV